jgi:prepilin-type N-terminal cleavage/methylation domain-containing protein
MKYIHTGPRAQQQGFTLVELGISMVLIASMVLAGFYVVKRIRTDAAINAAIASANVSMNKAKRRLLWQRLHRRRQLDHLGSHEYLAQGAANHLRG